MNRLCRSTVSGMSDWHEAEAFILPSMTNRLFILHSTGIQFSVVCSSIGSIHPMNVSVAIARTTVIHGRGERENNSYSIDVVCSHLMTRGHSQTLSQSSSDVLWCCLHSVVSDCTYNVLYTIKKNTKAKPYVFLPNSFHAHTSDLLLLFCSF